MAEWPYRSSLDCVVEAPDGRFAGYCLMWPDDENRVGELEPVGVREEFRRPRRGRCRLHVRAAALVRGGRTHRRSSTAIGAGLRALRVDRLPHSRDHCRVLPMNRLAQETSPYLLQHAGQPGRLVPVGRRGVRARARRGQADPALGRLRGVPLVPRDGARVLRGRGDGAAHERALRQHQGRPRGAARRRLGLHGRGRRADAAAAAGR